jgi:hypothetical protein
LVIVDGHPPGEGFIDTRQRLNVVVVVGGGGGGGEEEEEEEEEASARIMPYSWHGRG